MVKEKEKKPLAHEQWLKRQGLRFTGERIPSIRRQKKSLAGQLDLFKENTNDKGEGME